MNKIIDKKQCTILWHFDDLKTSYFNSAAISRVLTDIDAEYGKIAKMTTTQGKVHKYLGITNDYFLHDKVIFSMINYIAKILDNILEYMKRESARTDAYHLFDIV